MSKYDLNKVKDFAAVTVAPGANLLFQLAGIDPSKWDIQEASYNGVKFHIFIQKNQEVWQAGLSRISDTGGRRKIKYMFPYRDGQTTDDLGRKPNTYQVEAMIHGLSYKEGLRDLLLEFDRATPGILIHPVFGELTCVIEEYTLGHTHESRNAVELSITFSEHNFTARDLLSLQAASQGFKSILSKALSAFGAIDRAIGIVDSAVSLRTTLKAQISAALAAYKTQYGTTLTNLNTTFNPPQGNQTPQETSYDIPGVLPTNQGGVRNPDGTVVATTSSNVTSPSDPFQAVPLAALRQTTQIAIATVQAVAQVKALREAANSIIALLSTDAGGQGGLDFYDTIQEIRVTSIQMQNTLEAGVKSSRALITNYTVPRLMTIREVAFDNGVPLENFSEIIVLNPSLQSVNYIEPGTVLRVPLQ